MRLKGTIHSEKTNHSKAQASQMRLQGTIHTKKTNHSKALASQMRSQGAIHYEKTSTGFSNKVTKCHKLQTD
jgi:hypothetical protein